MRNMRARLALLVTLGGIAIVAGCGHVATAPSAKVAMRKGEAVCRHLHKFLEAAGPVPLPGLPTPVGILMQAIQSNTGYTRRKDLDNAFVGCVRSVWTSDLGPRPSVPSKW